MFLCYTNLTESRSADQTGFAFHRSGWIRDPQIELRKTNTSYRLVLRCIDSKYMFGKDVEELRLRVTFNLCYTVSDAGQRTDALAIANDLLENSVLADSGGGVTCAISESLWVLHKTGSDPEKLRYSVKMLIYLAIATNCPLLENNLRRQFADLL